MSLTSKIVDELIKLRESSRSFIDKKLFTKNGYFWKTPGNYEIYKSDNTIDVFNCDEYIATFSNKKVAVAWCILSFHNKKDESRSLKYYDNKYSRLETDIFIEKKKLQRCDTQEEKDIVYAKLSNDIQRLKLSKKQIDKLVNLAKYFQIQGFKYEAF